VVTLVSCLQARLSSHITALVLIASGEIRAPLAIHNPHSTWVARGHVTWSHRDIVVRWLQTVGNNSETELAANHKVCNYQTFVDDFVEEAKRLLCDVEGAILFKYYCHIPNTAVSFIIETVYGYEIHVLKVMSPRHLYYEIHRAILFRSRLSVCVWLCVILTTSI